MTPLGKVLSFLALIAVLSLMFVRLPAPPAAADQKPAWLPEITPNPVYLHGYSGGGEFVVYGVAEGATRTKAAFYIVVRKDGVFQVVK